MRLLMLLSLVLTHKATAHGGEHSASANFITHLLSEHGLSLGLAVLVIAAVLWALVLYGEKQD